MQTRHFILMLLLGALACLASACGPIVLAALDTDFRDTLRQDLQATAWQTSQLKRTIKTSTHPGASVNTVNTVEEPDFNAVWHFSKDAFESPYGNHYHGRVVYQGKSTPFIWRIAGHSEANRKNPPSLELDFTEEAFEAFPTDEIVYGKTLYWHGFWEPQKFIFRFRQLTAHAQEERFIEEEWTFTLLPH